MEYDNVSLDGKVGFIEEGHKYVLMDDKKFKFNSVTTLLHEYAEPFEKYKIAERVSKKFASQYYGMSVTDIIAQWEAAAAEGTRLHAYGEALLKGEDVEAPDLPKAKWVPEIVQKLKDDGYVVAKTELLVYSKDLALAGQSDIILKKKVMGEWQFMVFDWKFLKDSLSKKGYYDYKKRSYIRMAKPFQYLDDCKWIHYSIQLAIYQTLSGDPEKITEKVLIVVKENGYDFVPAYPMRVFWDENNKLQAVYETWKGKYYDSRVDKLLWKWPSDIKGR
jgi:hypothetical protein